MEITGKQVSADRIRLAAKSHGLQKQLAIEIGISNTELSKFLGGQLPKLALLLEALDLEVVAKGHINDLRRCLKEVL